MAQYYYDLSVVDKDGIPALMKGERSSTWGNANARFGKVNGFFAQLGVALGGVNAELGLAAGINVSNVEALLKTSVSLYTYGTNYANTSGATIFLRAQGGEWSTARARNGYYFTLNGSSSLESHARTLAVFSYENGGYGSLDVKANNVMDPHTSNAFDEFYYIRAKCIGTSIQARAWKEGTPEPSTWQIDTSSSVFTGPGDVFIGFGRGSAYVVPFLSIGTDGDSAPMEYPGGNRLVYGTLLKPDRSAAEGYLVRCYHRATGCLLGETLSDSAGAFTFSLPIPETELVYCLAVDQLGNEWEAPIKEVSPILP